VVTAASWSNRLLAPLGLAVPLTVTREHVAYYPYLEGQRLVPFICHEEGSSFDELYGLPNGARRQIKVGLHKTGPEVDPDSEAVLEESRIQAISDAAQALLPSLDAQQATGETCLYASTPDDDFVIDRPASWGSDSPASRGSGSLGPIVLGIGFGGHGFKFGAVIGKLLADLVEGKPIPFGQRFSHRRFTAHTIT
jgi:sarcosine oxidase